MSPAGPAAHIRSMTTLRQEAQDPATAPERLHELIHLAGDRGAQDTMARFNAARNPSLDVGTLRLLAEDRLDFIANAARERPGMPRRPGPGLRIPGVPHFDPRTGRMSR